MSIDEVLAELDEIAAADTPWNTDRAFSYVFAGPPDLVELGHEAYRRFSGANGLDPTVFTSLVRFENDLISFIRPLLGGDGSMVGTVTSGGTESIMLAVKAARDAGSDHAGGTRADPGGSGGNIVIAETAHAAFHKAAHYLGLEVRPVTTDEGFRVDPDRLLAAVDPATVLVAVSAPGFAHGVVDPIEAIGPRCAEAGVWLHVDACMGGLTLPFIDGSPRFGFDIEGVTSVSVDLHKYGYTPKGASIVAYRHGRARLSQYFATADWSGYPMVNPTMQSTRSVGPVAAAWAVTRHLGHDGYAALAADARSAAWTLARWADAEDRYGLVAEPDATLVSITHPDVFGVGQALRGRGWVIGPTPHYGSSPAHLHFTFTSAHLPLIDDLLADLEAEADLPAAQAIDLSSMATMGDRDVVEALLAGAGDADRETIDRLIDALTPDQRALAVTLYLDRLFTPRPSG